MPINSYPNKYQSLGEMLYQARLQKNITIEELSTITKIHKTLIHSLESDDLVNLPNKIYVLGFLKSISEALGIDLIEANRLYERKLLIEGNVIKVEQEDVMVSAPDKVVSFTFNQQKRMIKLKWLVLFFLLVVTFVIVWPLFFQNDINSTPKEEVTEVLKTSQHKSVPEEKIMHVEGSLKISINAKYGNSWVTFKVDKNPVRKLVLKKGSQIVLIGEKIGLSFGNYKALEVLKNEQAVNIDRKGKSVDLPVTLVVGRMPAESPKTVKY